MSVWELYTQLFARNWRCGRFAWSLSQGCSEKIRKKDVVMTAGRWSSWSIHIPQFLMFWWPAIKAGSTAMTQRPRYRVPTPGMIYMHWVPTEQTVNKEYYVEVLREFRKRFIRKWPAVFKSGQWHFQQDNTLIYNSTLVTDYLTKMGIKTVPHPPYCPDLARCDFCLFPKVKEKLRGCRYETRR